VQICPCGDPIPPKKPGSSGPQRRFCEDCRRERNAAVIVAWGERNSDRVRAAGRRYEERNKEQRKARKKPGYVKPEASETSKKARAFWLNSHPSNELFAAAKRRAKDKGLPFNITRDDIQIPEKCPVLGIRLVRAIDGKRTDASPSVDRTKPELGYVKGNVRVISWRANDLKGNASVEELEAVIAYLKKLQCT
jgi:hypothetical protein